MKNDESNKNVQSNPNPWALIDALMLRAERQVFPDLKARGQKLLDWVQSFDEKGQSDLKKQ